MLCEFDPGRQAALLTVVETATNRNMRPSVSLDHGTNLAAHYSGYAIEHGGGGVCTEGLMM